MLVCLCGCEALVQGVEQAGPWTPVTNNFCRDVMSHG